jgi:prepilin-type N-terminal cleavage/methylation domain-containing protein
MSAPRKSPGRVCGARGYTAIEVLIAMTVMAIGAAAVMTMQKASIQGNLDARRLDVANGIARMWEERLQADATAWTQPNGNAPTVTNLSAHNGALIADGIGKAGQWFLPGDYMTNTVPESYMFDILGRDLKSGNSANAIFCVAVRMTILVPGTVALAPALLRADVRVLWLRDLGSNPSGGAAFCAANGDAVSSTPPAPDPATYHALYVTTALKGNPAP